MKNIKIFQQQAHLAIQTPAESKKGPSIYKKKFLEIVTSTETFISFKHIAQ